MTMQIADRLRLADFTYDLPAALIAQEPAVHRDASRLLVLNRRDGRMEHGVFADIESHVSRGDVLVVNDTKVFPCRLEAKKRGGGKAEIFLLSEQQTNQWQAMVKGVGSRGGKLGIADGIQAEIKTQYGDGTCSVRFTGVGDLRDVLPALGKTPLPPYIKREPELRDRERYQTVYASNEGAVAAPTAGLHFTSELLRRMTTVGIEIAKVTLHVGPGTFQPVRTDVIAEHRMHPEQYFISQGSARIISRAKAEGRRVIAVGTTSVRAIETAADVYGRVAAGGGQTSLFIFPGYVFRVTDAMITNFHLPKSTLLLLVAAFAGRDAVLKAYRTAVEEQYRFFSYGDAMLIL